MQDGVGEICGEARSGLVENDTDISTVGWLDFIPAGGASRYNVGNFTDGELFAVVLWVDYQRYSIDSNHCRSYVYVGIPLVFVLCLQRTFLFGSNVAGCYNRAGVHCEQRVESLLLSGVAHKNVSIGILILEHIDLLSKDILKRIVAHHCGGACCRGVGLLFVFHTA